MQSPREYAPSAEMGDFRLILDDMSPKEASPEVLARRHAAMLAFARRASAQPEIGVLMLDAMALLAEALETDWGGIGELQPDGQSIVMRIGPTDNHGKVVNPATVNVSSLPANSMAGYALTMACPVTSNDLAAESRFTDYALRRLGVVSALCVPLNLSDQMFGSLGVYATTARAFTVDDVHFAETIGHLLSSTIARTRAEAEIARQKEFAATFLDLTETMLLTLDLEGNLLDMNRACQQTTGFSVEETRGRPVWQALIAPEEADLVQGLLYTSSAGIRPCEFESSILTKSGTRRRAVWAIKAVASKAQGKSVLLMAGTDRTDRVELEAELQKARAAAERTAQMMMDLQSRVNKAADMASLVDPARAVPENHSTSPSAQQNAKGGGKDLRASPRLAYHYYQLIAPLYNLHRMPPRKDFFPVECNDISAGGISFLFDRRPDFDNLVVSLGRPPAETYFTAHIVRIAREEKEGKTVYLVGCRFTGRTTL